jgi:hypothetical protein
LLGPSNLRPDIAAAIFGLLALAWSRDAPAAGGLAVDDIDIDPVGHCKLESWLSFGSNRDRIGVATPGCVFEFGRPVDVTFGFVRGRFDGTQKSGATVKLKTLMTPTETGKVGAAVSAAATYSINSNEMADFAVGILTTFRIVENVKVNLNGGWLNNLADGRHGATWGAGVDWSVNDRISLIGEAFGLLGNRDAARPHANDPRAQLAVRLKPTENVDLDVIYGRNILGENAHWITVGLNVRFNVFGERAAPQ